VRRKEKKATKDPTLELALGGVGFFVENRGRRSGKRVE